ncbi:hypothetical protein AB0B45_27050 [Nonomuraea sp. NPDC049152]|uniref:hypothetical protein n=1 Tax=Nonomuraea sp. NPDC049152 TaxID=3154350 RepID=UPI0033C43828
MTNMTEMSATQWLASACRDGVRLASGLAKLRQDKSARSQLAFHAGYGAAAAQGAPVYVAGADVPTQQITKGGLRGPHPWRDEPVIT